MKTKKIFVLSVFCALAALSIQGCGKKGNPQPHCQAKTFPPSYGRR